MGYIEREAFLDAIERMKPYHQDADDIAEMLQNFPASNVRPVMRGEWIPDFDYAEYDFDGITPLPEPQKFQDGWQCSLCGQYMPSEANYCPNCGADMRAQ